MVWRQKIKSLWWAINGVVEPGPLGYEHAHTATAACSYGRHWNCGITVINFKGGGTCSCPCHLE